MNFLSLLYSSLFVSLLLQSLCAADFAKYYFTLWGKDHTVISPAEVTLRLDRSSGAGFRSMSMYGSGLFHIRMKIPEKPTGGVVTCFYLTSAPDVTPHLTSAPNVAPLPNHFELDFEFLGTNGTVQTNVYLNEVTSHREQSFTLWFNPAEDFHTYEILWNSHQIVFIVDKIPIRVFKNNAARGIPFPNVPMQIEASIWNADWAGVVDWSKAPFIAHYQDFDFSACVGNAGCDSDKYFWNQRGYWELSAADKDKMALYRKKYMTYDYCMNPSTAKPECSLND